MYMCLGRYPCSMVQGIHADLTPGQRPATNENHLKPPYRCPGCGEPIELSQPAAHVHRGGWCYFIHLGCQQEDDDVQ